MRYLLLLPLICLGQIVYGQELPGIVLSSKMENSCELTDEGSGSPANGAMIDVSLTANRNNTLNTALAFDLNTSYITLGVVNKLKLTGDKSISFWIKPTITGSNRTGSIFTYGNGIVVGYQEQASVPKLNISFGNILYLQTDLTSQWQAVTITFTKDYTLTKSKASIYIDGIPKSEAERDKTSQDFNNSIAIMGPANQTAPANGFRGYLDDFKMYNRALTATEILNAALPAKLQYFTGKRINGVVQLTWKTFIEDNVSHFVIQRSKDGIAFQTISKMLAGKHNYLALDNTPGGTDAWYRLQIVDKDGKTKYSSVIKIGHDNSLESGIIIFPNPATGTINLKGIIANCTIKIISVTGALVKQLYVTDKINIADIRPGLYYIVIYDDLSNKKMIAKFIKKNDR